MVCSFKIIVFANKAIYKKIKNQKKIFFKMTDFSSCSKVLPFAHKFKDLSRLPDREDPNEWFAVHGTAVFYSVKILSHSALLLLISFCYYCCRCYLTNLYFQSLIFSTKSICCMG